MTITFPDHFIFGTSTAAVQIETAHEHDWQGFKARDNAVFQRTTDHEKRFAEDAALLDKLRSFLKQESVLSARVVPGKEEEGAKFRDYFAHDELLRNAPSHRALAIFRGRNEGVLSASLKVGEVLRNTFRYLGVVRSGEPFYLFARLDPYEQAELQQKSVSKTAVEIETAPKNATRARRVVP